MYISQRNVTVVSATGHMLYPILNPMPPLHFKADSHFSITKQNRLKHKPESKRKRKERERETLSQSKRVPTHLQLSPAHFPPIYSLLYIPLPSRSLTQTQFSLTPKTHQTMSPQTHFFVPIFFLIFLTTTLTYASTTPKTQTLNTNSNPPQIQYINPKLPQRAFTSSKKYEGSSNLVHLRYHMGPVLSSSPINIYLIWYGNWPNAHKQTIKQFLLSLSSTSAPSPSVSDWWNTLSLYTDQTGANVSRTVLIAGEHSDLRYQKICICLKNLGNG